MASVGNSTVKHALSLCELGNQGGGRHCWCSRCRNPPHKRFLALGRVQLTLHATRRIPHGASRLVQAMPVWWAKSRRAPPRHCRNVRGCGGTTTAMHDMSTPRYKVHALYVCREKTLALSSSTRVEVARLSLIHILTLPTKRIV